MSQSESRAAIEIIGISGSLRAASYNTGMLRAAQTMLPEAVSIEIVSLADLPIYNADVERSDGFPPAVDRFRRALAAADGILFATPEYNYSVTAALKNAIDWASRGPESPLDRKPAALMGAGGGSGAARSQRHLREILTHNRLRVVERPEVMVRYARSHFDEHGTLIDADVREQIAALVRALVDKIEASRDARRVLVVGRHRDAMRIAVDLLEGAGHVTTPSLDDESAATALRSGRFDAVVIGGGVEVESQRTIAVLAEAALPGIEVVIANGGPESILDALGWE